MWMEVPLYFQILRLPLYLLDEEVVKINYKLTWKQLTENVQSSFFI